MLWLFYEWSFIGRKYNSDIRAIIDAKTSEELSMLPVFTMECGTEDFMVHSANVEFDAYLTQKELSIHSLVGLVPMTGHFGKRVCQRH